MVTSFAICLFIFVIIGVLSTIANRHNNVDYLLADHSIKPWLVALSAVATANSGYMFIGMIGYTYFYGISSIWLLIGWVFGDFIASLFIHKKLRIISKEKSILSFAGAISKWGGTDYKTLRIYLGIITVIFLGVYAAAQLNAGSKALHILFGWDYNLGAIIGAIMVLLYCFAGGIRASIWTDAAQSFVMIFAMMLLCFVAIDKIGGIGEVFNKMNEVSVDYVALFPHNLALGSFVGPLLFISGWFFAGIGIVGQPHIMVRFMAMDNPDNMTKVRIYYYSFYVIFCILTVLVGISARLLLPDTANFDAELALPILAMDLLPEILVGLILAGLFAATMSTADSQILSCSAAITRDFNDKGNISYLITKLSTIFVTLTALLIAIYGSKSVFDLVIIAWSSLAASFAPLLIIYACGGKISERIAIIIAILGMVTIIIWRVLGLDKYIYEVAPGILLPILFWIFYNFTYKILSNRN
ncbi:sodium/proline symporter [Rickettsiales bacterium]|nr:sodium/proline symporter [Rickettsiales bacterium]